MFRLYLYTVYIYYIHMQYIAVYTNSTPTLKCQDPHCNIITIGQVGQDCSGVRSTMSCSKTQANRVQGKHRLTQ